ncbi:hypothetical protein BLA28_04620 [Eisenbergiella tayi]|uniref:Accessory gene regulator protein B n=1 Tax=Eisenbergiella tayi TaxID=1432052 RepID=A0A1E3AY34_9FIRM|nr:accessory gene regulator B family protein [Eisenbergiella tayi]ODM13618.1 Accessory gene regulator protein B [Eisenbergiella tayi]OIZ66248.1 hypothetical protein BLA28_04620 [Eisenbergiella tayi]
MKLTENFIREGIINADDKEIIEFGLTRIKDLIIGLCITFIIGICFGIPGESLIFWIFSMPLRINAGGYHADSRTGCNLISSVSIIVCFYFISNVFWKEVPSFFACLLFWVIIYKMSPVQNKRKELDAKEKRVYKRRSRIIVSIEGLILTTAFVFQWNTLIKIITMVFFIMSLSLAAGHIKNRIR